MNDRMIEKMINRKVNSTRTRWLGASDMTSDTEGRTPRDDQNTVRTTQCRPTIRASNDRQTDTRWQHCRRTI